MSKLFEKIEDLSDYLFRIVDNGGATFDRHTVIFSDGDYLGLSTNPSSPQGFSQWGENISLEGVSDQVEEGTEIDMAIGDLTPRLAQHILSRCNEGYADFLELVENNDPKAVAVDRKTAEVNEGIHSSGCKGIYRTEAGYHVRVDGEVEDDRGPYATAREAVIGTLPDTYGLSGPEYHSTTDVMRLEASEKVAAAIAELEAKIEAGPTP